MVALLFKVGVAPFHMWLPDVYQGAPTAVTALFAITPKISIIILILRLYLTTFYGLFFELSVLFFICSILSMGIGAVGALNQSFIKRLLAYSAIAHTGYILLSLSVGTYTSIFSLLVYMVVYIITTVSVFTTLLALPSHVSSSNNFLYLIGFTGLSRYNPVLAATLLISLLSLAGVPPLSGFFGK